MCEIILLLNQVGLLRESQKIGKFTYIVVNRELQTTWKGYINQIRKCV